MSVDTQATTIAFIPLAIDVEIDQEELRDVQLVIRKPGASPLVESLTNGRIVLTDIYPFDPLIDLELVDKYSQTNPIQVQMVEHTRGWESVSLLTTSIREDDNSSTLNVFLILRLEKIDTSYWSAAMRK